MDYSIPQVKIEFFDCENEYKGETINKYKCGEIIYMESNTGEGQRIFNMQCLHCSLTFMNFADFIGHVNEIFPRVLKDEEHMDEAIPGEVYYSDSDSKTPAISPINFGPVKSEAPDRSPHKDIANIKRHKKSQSSPNKNGANHSKYFRTKVKIEKEASLPKRRQCYMCGDSFQNTKHLKLHVQDVHTPKSYQCNICDKVFPIFYKFRNHLRTHNKVYNFICDICGKQYANLSNIKIHMRNHSGQRPFQCNLCDRSFINNSSLSRHKNFNHLNMKGRFMCNYCGKVYRGPSRLVEHIRTHTGENPFKCNYCEKTFTRKCHLIQHERIHTGEKPFKCHFCDNRYATYAGVSQHEKCMHKQLLEVTGKLKPIRIIDGIHNSI